MSYTNIVTNAQIEFINALKSSDGDCGWVFFHEDSEIRSILMDSRKFSRIPRNQIKAAAMLVMPNPECDTNVKCVKCSNIIYDYETEEITFKEIDEDSEESRVVYRVHNITLKGTKGLRPRSPKSPSPATVSRKSSRNPQHSTPTRNESSKRQKSTHRTGNRSKDRKVDTTTKFFSGVSF